MTGTEELSDQIRSNMRVWTRCLDISAKRILHNTTNDQPAPPVRTAKAPSRELTEEQRAEKIKQGRADREESLRRAQEKAGLPEGSLLGFCGALRQIALAQQKEDSGHQVKKESSFTR